MRVINEHHNQETTCQNKDSFLQYHYQWIMISESLNGAAKWRFLVVISQIMVSELANNAAIISLMNIKLKKKHDQLCLERSFI